MGASQSCWKRGSGSAWMSHPWNHSRVVCNPIPQENGMIAVPGEFPARFLGRGRKGTHPSSMALPSGMGMLRGTFLVSLRGQDPPGAVPVPHSLGSCHQDFPSDPSNIPRVGNADILHPLCFYPVVLSEERETLSCRILDFKQHREIMGIFGWMGQGWI